jgi:hypothetical protein
MFHLVGRSYVSQVFKLKLILWQYRPCFAATTCQPYLARHVMYDYVILLGEVMYPKWRVYHRFMYVYTILLGEVMHPRWRCYHCVWEKLCIPDGDVITVFGRSYVSQVIRLSLVHLYLYHCVWEKLCIPGG